MPKLKDSSFSVKNWMPCDEHSFIETKNLPIKRYSWSNGTTIWAVMPDELREIIGIEVEEIERNKSLVKSHKSAIMVIAENYSKLEKDFIKLRYANFWNRLKFLFKWGY